MSKFIISVLDRWFLRDQIEMRFLKSTKYEPKITETEICVRIKYYSTVVEFITYV